VNMAHALFHNNFRKQKSFITPKNSTKLVGLVHFVRLEILSELKS